jgi:hypothetical protein
MKKLCFALIALLLLAAPSARASDAPNPTVLELFTSQGCIACPPADMLFKQLAAKDNVIAFSCHVDYWDKPQWKDTLSQHFCTQRQHVYALREGTRQVYTPMLVINNRHSMIGSDARAIDKELPKAAKDGVFRITLSHADNGKIRAKIPDVTGFGYYKPELILLGYAEDETQDIKGGENEGARVHYVRPVNMMQRIGTPPQKAATILVDPPLKGENYILLIQDGPGGAILAAGELKKEKPGKIEPSSAL